MINLLFGGNNKIYDGILLCLMSASKHTIEPLNVFILTANLTHLNPDFKPLTERDRQSLESYIQSKNSKSKVTLIQLGKDFNFWVENSKNKLNQYTPFAFLRLFADKVNLPDKIIYLDTDTMLNGDISELFKIDILNYELGAVLDRYGHIFLGKNYFNSGVLLLNLKEIKNSNLFERVKQKCLTEKMFFPDQTALNKFAKKVLYLPRKFNEQANPKKDTIIQHFSKRIIWFPFHTINIKPWQIDLVQKRYKIHNYDDIYAEFKDLKKDNKHKKTTP